MGTQWKKSTVLFLPYYQLGRKHGLKHSPSIAREITKDTIMCALILIGTIALVRDYLQRDKIEGLAWREYYYGELKTKRDNIPD
jgi:hypothetical protein